MMAGSGRTNPQGHVAEQTPHWKHAAACPCVAAITSSHAPSARTMMSSSSGNPASPKRSSQSFCLPARVVSVDMSSPLRNGPGQPPHDLVHLRDLARELLALGGGYPRQLQ